MTGFARQLQVTRGWKDEGGRGEAVLIHWAIKSARPCYPSMFAGPCVVVAHGPCSSAVRWAGTRQGGHVACW